MLENVFYMVVKGKGRIYICAFWQSVKYAVMSKAVYKKDNCVRMVGYR